MIIGWDLATKLCGWCAGDGSVVPTAGAFRLENREVLTDMGMEFKARVLEIHERFPASHWVVEQPLLLPHDALWTLERIYGVVFLLHTLAGALGVVCKSVDQGSAKAEFSGRIRHPKSMSADARRRANKDAMILIAEKIGVKLPALDSEGREDAADACGVWKVGIRLFARHRLERIDAAIYSHRGALL